MRDEHAACDPTLHVEFIKKFIAGNGEFSIMIGLAVDGEAVLGVVYMPDGDRIPAVSIRTRSGGAVAGAQPARAWTRRLTRSTSSCGLNGLVR